MNDKLDILLINRWVGYNEGGNEAHMQGLIKWFNKLGHKITVITTKGDVLEKLEGLNKNNLDIHYINTPQGYYSYGYMGIFYAAIFLMKSFLAVVKLRKQKRHFDLVSVHFSLEAVLARFLKLFFGYPYVMRLAGDTRLELLEGKRADGAIHVSHFMNQQSIKMGYSAEVIPKGFELTIFNPNHDVSELAKVYKSSPEDKILLSVCRLDPRKNLITLIEAMDIIVNRLKIKDIKLIIVGDGIERQFLQNSVTRYELEPYIKFAGKISNKDPLLAKFYVLADLFVLPTLYEGFGWVFFEAMACGTPVLTTNAGSNPEVVGDAGIMIETKNPELLATTIVKTLANKELLINLKEKGLKKAQSLPWEKQILKYDEFYRKVSTKKCATFTCKLKVLWFIIVDSFSITANLLKGTIFNKISDKKSSWKGNNQLGLN